jgi:hypothetical protein
VSFLWSVREFGVEVLGCMIRNGNRKFIVIVLNHSCLNEMYAYFVRVLLCGTSTLHSVSLFSCAFTIMYSAVIMNSSLI